MKDRDQGREFDKEEVLVVHLGGLGDVCLSESVFFSLREHFGNCLVALGSRRFLDLFGEYFNRTEGVESRHWLYLFSERLTGPRWKRIVFIGKDRQGSIRKRWRSYSEEELVFIDMYPDDAFSVLPEGGYSQVAASEMHIEDYQLAGLSRHGIGTARKEIADKRADRIILYPEEGFKKEKWPVENFISLFNSLQGRGVNVALLRPEGLSILAERALFIEDLSDVKGFFSEGGLFVSNDSGMAHLAGACGLPTLTIFNEFDPVIWHPRGHNISLRLGIDKADVETVIEMIEEQGSGFRA